MDTPENLKDFNRLFPDEAACVDYLAEIRWGKDLERFACRKCGGKFASRIRSRGLVRCENVR